MKGRNLLGLHHCDDFFAGEEMLLSVRKKGSGECSLPPQPERKFALGFANSVR